ncbi:MAG: nicotinate (nicotinamide) nucleotide adenylyltransferase [Oscillospiraceae bacterium]|nr:nicotinate (nicotinamide) nucleotide adenylyltransferase [Oscillospiraceae bacterium]
MERIGIYGGTFNPPHIGHLHAAARAVEALNLDRLLLVPVAVPPHKPLPAGSPTGAQRAELLRLAVRDLDALEICTLELDREGPSYTWETVHDIRAQYPAAELFLLMGTDMLESFHQWRHPERILPEVTLAAFGRGGKGEKARLEKARENLEAMGAKVLLMDTSVVNISSTQIRRMLMFQCTGPFLPPQIRDHILAQGLYGVDRDLRKLSMEELEQVVVSLLDPKRVPHVLGCRDTAAKLAEIWGADVTDAARAGLLHDITKALDGPLQLTLCDEYGTILDDFSRRYPKTLHALTGSLVARRIFGENDAVVSAIRSHTTGKADMNTLEKIIYVADYMEPCRDFPGVEKLRHLAVTDLDAALKCGLEMTLEHLARQGSEVSPETREALAWLNR